MGGCDAALVSTRVVVVRDRRGGIRVLAVTACGHGTLAVASACGTAAGWGYACGHGVATPCGLCHHGREIGHGSATGHDSSPVEEDVVVNGSVPGLGFGVDRAQGGRERVGSGSEVVGERAGLQRPHGKCWGQQVVDRGGQAGGHAQLLCPCHLSGPRSCTCGPCLHLQRFQMSRNHSPWRA